MEKLRVKQSHNKRKRETGRCERRRKGGDRDAVMERGRRRFRGKIREETKRKRKERKEGREERKAKERKKEEKGEVRRPWLGRRSPAAAGVGRSWPEKAAKAQNPNHQVGCKYSSFGKFGVLEMVFWRAKQ